MESESKIVAIASSTGGPKALEEVITKLPAELNAPVVIVQHMPKGFTASLAERLNSKSKIKVKEAEEGDILHNGIVYLSKGGVHLNIIQSTAKKNVIHYSNQAMREGVKPCANYMYESLIKCNIGEVICVVLTGMGADGREGIIALNEHKKIYTITQSKETCVVYGMPKSIVKIGLSDQAVAIQNIAKEIVMKVGTCDEPK
ncbi:MAG: CheB methylesterase domain-containing protein [Lachnospiraceae bacterium]